MQKVVFTPSKLLFTVFLSCFFILHTFAQTEKEKVTKETTTAATSATIKEDLYLSGSATVANNGISLIPLFALGKPSLQFEFIVGKDRLSFEPQWWYAINGKPWAYLLWLRYQLKNEGRFRTRVGIHLGMPFGEGMLLKKHEAITTTYINRYFVTEIAPYFIVNKNLRIGAYYFYSVGLDEGAIKSSQYGAINASISNIELSETFLLGINPQFYYLNLGGDQGVYTFLNANIYTSKSPFSLTFNLNKKVKTNIEAGKDLDWNIGLVYRFRKSFQRIQ